MVNSQIQYLLKATIRSTIKRCIEGGNLENEVLPLRLCAVAGGIPLILQLRNMSLDRLFR